MPLGLGLCLHQVFLFMARISAAGQRRRQKRALKNAEKAEDHELKALTKNPPPQPKAQPSPFFEKLPPELRNKIYDLIFTWDDFSDTCEGPWDTSHLRPLQTCRNFYDEAHEMAYTRIWHRIEYLQSIKERSIARRYSRLRQPTRKLVNKVWLETDQACFAQDDHLKIWRLATYALNMPYLSITELYLGVRCCHCHLPNWDMQMNMPGEVLIAQQLLGTLRVWKTLRVIRIGLSEEFLLGWDCVRPDLLMHAVMREIRRKSRAYEFAVRPAMVFDREWDEWVGSWEVVGGEHSHEPGCEPMMGVTLRGMEDTVVEGREVVIECVKCEICRIHDGEGDGDFDG